MNGVAEALAGAVPAAVVLIAMCAVGLLLIGRMRPRGRHPHPSRYQAPDDLPGFFGGFVTVVALAQGLAVFGMADAAPGLLLGAMIAFGLSLTKRFGALLATVAGGFGILSLVVQVFFTGHRTVERLLLIAGVAFVMLVGAFAARLVGRAAKADLLLVFAVLDVLLFIIEPLGVPLLAQSLPYVPIALVIATAAGFFGAMAPNAVLGVSSLLMGIASIGIAAGVGDLAGVRTWSGVLALLGYCLTWVLSAGLRRKR
ncbi:hypothetical protein Q9R19_11255 [Microbacterium sp. ARD32]|uniref:hypothetical protein n=1 Tax=Microbacterium sp. ARD32 TaxID=2962577 RepID=UPI0028822141|nr:hypothetical protein [Microbacterium sp. ARD32]MDT0158203.1 hypothetical protein [Microbacterium sp. ARD32]